MVCRLLIPNMRASPASERRRKGGKPSNDIGDLFGILDEVVADSANQIGREQIAHIESQKAEIESLRNQLRERDQLIEMLKQKKSRHRIDLSYLDTVIQTLLNSQRVDRETTRKLQALSKERDQASKVNGVVELLMGLSNASEAAAARMCTNVANLAVLLEQLASDREHDESLIESGRFKLTDRLREFLCDVLAQTTEFLGEEPQASALQMNNLDSSQRKKDLEKLLSREPLSRDELQALVLQEMSISDVLADCLRRTQQRPASTSPKTSPTKERQAMRKQLIEELTPEIEEKVRAEMEPNRDSLEQELREQIREEVLDDVTARLKRELRPKIAEELRDELEPTVDGELRDSLKPQIERELRRSLKPQIEDELRETLQPQVKRELQAMKGDLQSEIEEEMRASLKPQITDEVRREAEQELRDELEGTIRSELEKEMSGWVSQDEAAEMEREIRARLLKQLRPQIEKELRKKLVDEMEEEIKRRVDEVSAVIGAKTRRELEELLRDEISSEYQARLDKLRESLVSEYQNRLEEVREEEREKMNEWIENTLKPELIKQIRGRAESNVRQDIEAQIRNCLNGNGDPELRRRIVEISRPILAQELRDEIGADATGLTRKQQEALSSVYLALCLASGVNCHDFDLDDFIELAGSLAHEVNEIRNSFEVKKGSLFRALLALKSEISQLDQYRTHTRSLLVMQSKCISDLRQQTGQASWLKWARKLRRRLLGDDECDTDDVAELRSSIEDAISHFVYDKPTKEDGAYDSLVPMTPPSVSRVSRPGKGIFVMPE